LRALREQALALRRLHPGWGAGRIRVQLRPPQPGLPLPDPSTVRRWLARAGLAARPPRPAPPPAPRADRPHQVWQTDASEQIRLRDGQRVSWLRLVDEASGAALFSRLFPQGRWVEVGAPAAQEALRHAFARWGRPEALRVDNGSPWASPEGSLPSELELWLAGLGVAVHRNRPRCPQANGKVERSQRTARDWAEPGRCDTPEQLQRRLDEEDRIQREVFPALAGQSRLQAYPDLRHSGRCYAATMWEAVCWDLEAALACLAEYVVQRKVDRDGFVYLYDHRHRVGASWRGQVVRVRFEAASRAWVFEHDGQEVGRSTADYLSQERICGLQVSRRPGRSAQRTRARRAARGATAGPDPDGRPGVGSPDRASGS
jgi:hypothetical protein